MDVVRQAVAAFERVRDHRLPRRAMSHSIDRLLAENQTSLATGPIARGIVVR
jgi:hypothetical protein